MSAPVEHKNDARVRFHEDGPNGAMFVRYEDCLMTWQEFVLHCEGQGLDQKFARQYVEALEMEEL